MEIRAEYVTLGIVTLWGGCTMEIHVGTERQKEGDHLWDWG